MRRFACTLVFCALAVAPLIAPEGPAPRVLPRAPQLSTPPSGAPVARPRRPARRVRVRSVPAARFSVPSPPALEAPAAEAVTVLTMPVPPLAHSAAPLSALFTVISPPQLAPSQLAALTAARPGRPSALMPMYASFMTLQALDYHSTTRALSSGVGREANPVAKAILKNRPAFVAAKVAATAAMVLATEKMWKKHPVRAVVFMAAANGAMGVIVARNYSVRQRDR